MGLIKDNIVKAIRQAAGFNPEIEVAPACILWPDRDHQWEAVVPQLQKDLPELLVHGDFAAEQRSGPAIWLRCVIAGKIYDVELPSDHVPIIYLPENNTLKRGLSPIFSITSQGGAVVYNEASYLTH